MLYHNIINSSKGRLAKNNSETNSTRPPRYLLEKEDNTRRIEYKIRSSHNNEKNQSRKEYMIEFRVKFKKG